MNTATDALIEAQSGAYTALADRIWGYAELGYEEQQSCAAHIDALERQGFRVRRGVAGIQPVAGTPLADGITQAGAMLDGVNRESVMLVVSDGEESCRGNPCAVARQLAQHKPHLKINVIDILGTGAGNCLAQATGGQVFTVSTVEELQLMTARAAEDVLPPEHCRR